MLPTKIVCFTRCKLRFHWKFCMSRFCFFLHVILCKLNTVHWTDAHTLKYRVVVIIYWWKCCWFITNTNKVAWLLSLIDLTMEYKMDPCQAVFVRVAVYRTILALMNMKLIWNCCRRHCLSSFFAAAACLQRAFIIITALWHHPPKTAESLMWILKYMGIHRNATIIMSWTHLHFEKA